MRDARSPASRWGTELVPAAVIVAVLAAGVLFLWLRDEPPAPGTLSAPVEDAPDGQAEPAARPAGNTVAEAPAEARIAEEQAASAAPPPDGEPASNDADPSEAPAEAAEVQAPSESALQAVRESPAPPEPPTVDEVRIDSGGLMVVAGRAEPGSRVDVIVDGDVVGTAEADASGTFAALGTIEVRDGARSVTLRATEGAVTTQSREEIILAPVARDPVIAAAPTPEDASAADDTPSAATETPEGSGATAAGDAATDREVAAVETPAQNEPAPASASGDGEAVTAQAPETDMPETAPVEDVLVLRSDAEGVSLLETGPDRPERVVLDTIGYSDAGVVQLSGRASAEAVEVRAYLDNRPVARLPVGEGGAWRGEVPEIDPGRYTLRIDALTAEGTVESRIETPFQREAPAVLAAADGLSAAGPVRAVTVQAGDTLWAIARDRYGQGVLYVQVFEANRASIRDPDLIYPGQVFDLPGD